MSDYRPLTPAYRREIQESIKRQIEELNTCNNNALVSAQKAGLEALAGLIRTLPDGYPIPQARRGD